MVIGAGQTGMLSIGQAPSHSGQTFRKPGAQSPAPYPPPGMPDPDPVGMPVHPEPVGMPVHPEPDPGMPEPDPGNPDPDPVPVGRAVAVPDPDPKGMVVSVEPATAVTFPTLTLPFLTLNPKVYEYAALFNVISLTFPLHFLSQDPEPLALPLLATVKVKSQVQVFFPTLTDSSSKVSPPALSKDRPTTSCWVITICIRTMGTHSHPSSEPIVSIILSSERTKGMVIGAGQTGMLSIGQAPSHSGQTFRKPGAQSPAPYPPPGMPEPDPGMPVHPEP